MDTNDAATAHVDDTSHPREAQPSAATPPDDPRELGNFMWERYEAGDYVDASLLDNAIEATQLAVGSDPKSSGDSELLIAFSFRLGTRFLLTEIVDDIHRAIPALQRALDLSPEKDSRRAQQLDGLAKLLHSFFNRGGVLQTVLDCAVLAARCAVELTRDGHAAKPGHYNNLGLSLQVRFECNGDPDDIEKSIAAHLRAVELTPDGHANKPPLYNNLGLSLQMRFRRNGDLHDIEQSIAAHLRAVELTPDGHANKPGRYSSLGNSFQARFKRNGVLHDIGQSIAAHLRAVELTPDGHTDKPRHYNNLGLSLQARFGRNGDMDDIEQSIAAHLRAVELTPDSHADKPRQYNNLGLSLQARFEHNGDMDDIEQSIAAHLRAVELTPDGHANKPGRYSSLGTSLQGRFKRNGDLHDIEQSIAALLRAVELTPDGHADKPGRYDNLGLSLRACFEHNGDMDDIECSIAAHLCAVELTPDGHAYKPGRYNNLGSSLRVRFEHDGDLDNIEQSIAAHLRAVELTPDDHAKKPVYYSNLGGSLQVRFKRNGDLHDIEQSIAAHLRAVELTPDSHANKPGRYNNLGTSLRVRFERNGDLDDIEQSIAAHLRAVELTPDGHANKPGRYNNLGTSLRVRFERNGDLDDIEQSIAAHLRAVELTPDGHADKPGRYNNLGNSLGARFERNGDMDDIEQSIAAHLRAVELTPDGHANKPGHYSSLAISMDLRCKSEPTQSNFDGAVQAYMDANAGPLGIPSTRLHSAQRCVNLHTSHPSFSTTESLLLAHSYVITVLPEIIWLGHDIHRRFDDSAELGGLVNAAVSAAIAAGSLRQAVEWLEAGRALIWSQVLSLRTPLDELQERQPTLAMSLRNVQLQLQHSAPSSFALARDTFDDAVGLTTNPEADRHRGLAIQYDALLKKIRECDGFEDFLRPQRLSSLTPSSTEPADGPIVFLNVDVARCDALGILPGGAITLIPLPDLSLERASQLRSLWARQLKGHSVRTREPGVQEAHEVHPNARPQLAANPDSHPLRHSSLIQEDDPLGYLPALMWEWIVGPVLKALNIPNPASSGCLPHVTWCPTGPLTQLPLHTAGLYSARDGPRAFNFIVSSYTPSLSAFRRSHEAAMKPKVVPNTLIVTQPASLGQPRIPQTTAEGTCVASILRDSQFASTLLNHEQATVSSVGGIISQFPWVHLACHGKQHLGDATQSAFALYDGPLSLADLMRTASNDAELAFLSACQTATGDASNPEESVHLAAGMLAVGFQGVVATMWSIMDEDAPIVVEAYYKKLLQLRESGEVGKGQTGAAYALHEAVAQLREKVGEGSFGRWAPFVHFGV